MSQQPEALRLAKALEVYNAGVYSQALVEEYNKASAMLRNQHAEIERLRAELAAVRNQEPVEWDVLPEDADERILFDREVETFGGDVRAAIAHALKMMTVPYPHGSYAAQCKIMANEVAKLYLAPIAQPAPNPEDEKIGVLKDAPFVVLPTPSVPEVTDAAKDLLAACKEFVRKVEAGEARSVRSYAQMKAAIAKAESARPAPSVPDVDSIVDLMSEFATHDIERGQMEFDKWTLREAVEAAITEAPKRKPLTDEQLREVLEGTNYMVRNAMHGPFWPEFEQACRAVEAAHGIEE